MHVPATHCKTVDTTVEESFVPCSVCRVEVGSGME